MKDPLISKRIERDVSSLGISSTPARVSRDSSRSMVVPSYNFASPVTSNTSVFRVQEQTMVAPLRAGTLVFPTPNVQEMVATRSDSEAAPQVRQKQQTASDSSVVQSDGPSKEVNLAEERVPKKDIKQSTTKVPKQTRQEEIETPLQQVKSPQSIRSETPTIKRTIDTPDESFTGQQTNEEGISRTICTTQRCLSETQWANDGWIMEVE